VDEQRTYRLGDRESSKRRHRDGFPCAESRPAKRHPPRGPATPTRVIARPRRRREWRVGSDVAHEAPILD